MGNLVRDLISYLEYLNSDVNLNVSVHFGLDIFARMPKNVFLPLMPYNNHTNAYCMMAKGIDHHKCLINQKNLIVKCQEGKPFLNICYAGAYEYVYPVLKNDVAVGFIAVSGYRHGDEKSDNILNFDLWKSALKTKVPLKLCEALIPPLCVMLEKLLKTHLKELPNEYYYILRFLNEYHSNVTLSELAAHLNRSKSHVSHLFKKESGMTIREYCNNLKLEDARKLLTETERSITTIALDTGFNDTSYFICLFKNKFHLSPLQYRKMFNSKKD